MGQRVKHKRSIGEVGFGIPCTMMENTAGWKSKYLLGEKRIELLYKAMRGEELPDGLFLTGQTGGGVEKITRNDVDWLGLTWKDVK